MVTSNTEPCNRKSVGKFFQNLRESDRATFNFISTIPRTDRTGYRPCPRTDMIVLKRHFILHESPRRPSSVHTKPVNPFIHPRAYLCKKYIYMRISEFVPGFKALSTRIRFDLKTQLFLYGHGFRPHVSDENAELFENAHQSGTF